MVASQLESILTDACKDILQCGRRTSAEPILSDLGLSSLRSDRIVQKLKYKHRVERLPNYRLPKVVSNIDWRFTRRGRQIPMWSKRVSDLYNKFTPDAQLDANITEKQYIQLIHDSVAAHEQYQRDMSMRSKPKLDLFLRANDNTEFKPYLRGPLTLGCRLMFRFRSGNIALNGPLAFSNREHDPSCPCCGAECESVVHCLIECPAYNETRCEFLSEVRRVVGEHAYQVFESSSSVDKAVCLLSHKWCDESLRSEVCRLTKQFMCKVWSSRKVCCVSSARPLLVSQPPPSSGSASPGGAEGYGQPTMPPIS